MVLGLIRNRSPLPFFTSISNGEDGEYKWIKAEEPEDASAKQAARTRKRATKVLNASLGKKTTIKVS